MFNSATASHSDYIEAQSKISELNATLEVSIHLFGLFAGRPLFAGLWFYVLSSIKTQSRVRRQNLYPLDIMNIGDFLGLDPRSTAYLLDDFERTGLLKYDKESRGMIVNWERYVSLCETFHEVVGKENRKRFAKNLFDGTSFSEEDLVKHYGYKGPKNPWLINVANVYTYLMRDNKTMRIKIGKSKHPAVREETLQAKDPDTELIAICDKDIEKFLHEHYAKYRVRGEWFTLNEKQVQELIEVFDFKDLTYSITNLI